MPKPSAESRYRLLVEGADDSHSVIHLMARHGFDWEDETKARPFIDAANGVDSLLSAITATLNGPYTRIGIILDANSNLDARWKQVRDRASKAQVDLPFSPDPEGTIVTGHHSGSRVGVWLMPDNASPGALEHFLGRLVLPGPIWTYASEVTAEARKRGAPCLEKDHAKSWLYTWLAWQEKPGLPFGTALRGRLFETDSEEASRFVSWFRRLFVED